MDDKVKKVLKQLAITVGLLTIGFWVLVNFGNTLTGTNQFVSLDKALFFAVALVVLLFGVRISVFMIGMFGGAIKDEFKDKGPMVLVPLLIQGIEAIIGLTIIICVIFAVIRIFQG